MNLFIFKNKLNAPKIEFLQQNKHVYIVKRIMGTRVPNP